MPYPISVPVLWVDSMIFPQPPPRPDQGQGQWSDRTTYFVFGFLMGCLCGIVTVALIAGR